MCGVLMGKGISLLKALRAGYTTMQARRLGPPGRPPPLSCSRSGAPRQARTQLFLKRLCSRTCLSTQVQCDCPITRLHARTPRCTACAVGAGTARRTSRRSCRGQRRSFHRLLQQRGYSASARMHLSSTFRGAHARRPGCHCWASLKCSDARVALRAQAPTRAAYLILGWQH